MTTYSVCYECYTAYVSDTDDPNAVDFDRYNIDALASEDIVVEEDYEDYFCPQCETANYSDPITHKNIATSLMRLRK